MDKSVRGEQTGTNFFREEFNEQGDTVFRFRLVSASATGPDDLTSFYRESLRDLLKIVRLYHNGRPVIVDAFAFFSDPDVLTPILDEERVP